jgi:hypothetical protein
VTDPRLPDRDATQVDALVADRYLDALLAAAERRADDAPADPSLDPDVREAARVLRGALVRVHPSFRFEVRLATRLAELAAAQAGRGRLVAGGGTVVPFPGLLAGESEVDPDLAAILRGDLDPWAAEDEDEDDDARAALDRRPLLVTGAITSAALSLAGVAWVAWRASRPAGRRSAMGRAARTAHARRAASAATGLAGPA